MTRTRLALGRLGEEFAAAHLERLGYEIIDRNARTRFGEIDLIAYDGRKLVFCEVKTRRAGGGSVWSSLRADKQLQVRRMARHWLADREDRPHAPILQFDAIGVVIDRHGGLVSLDHREKAF